MATDAHGWMEVYDPEDGCWDAVIMGSQFMDRDYTLFDTLFGVRSTATPIAFAGRGPSQDISPHVADELKEWGSMVWPTRVR